MSKNNLIESFSGIRGIYGKGLDEELAEKYAYVYASFLISKFKKVRVVVGGDARKSTKRLQKVFIKVFLSFGFEVIDAGVASTPVVEFGVREYKAQGGAVITASHNEPEYNGWKLLRAGGAILYAKDSQRIIEGVGNFAGADDGFLVRKKKLIKKEKDVENRYIDEVFKIIGKKAIKQIQKKEFKLVADPNGGPVIGLLKKLFKKLNVNIAGVNMKEGVYGRKVLPNFETLKYLGKIIRREKADFGFGLDGDADRVEIVLPSGRVVSGNEMMAIGVEGVLSSKKKGQKVVVNLPTSHLVHEIADKYQSKIYEVDVGETNVVSKMEELGSLVGGEGSCGGLVVRPCKCRDGLLSVVVILAFLARMNKSVVEILDGYPEYFEERVEVVGQEEVGDKIFKHFKNKGYNIRRAPGKTGGFKILFDKYNWLFFRRSLTEHGLFRVIANGNDRQLVKKMIKKGNDAFYTLNK